MRVFGLTGGLASGKSTVASRFREQGVPVVDADELAREVVDPGSKGLAAVVARFGPSVLHADGTLDRAKLAEIVFTNEQARADLNAILHPMIAARSAERIGEHAAAGASLVCYEAALLVENGLADAFRPLVVVAVPEGVQVARAMARDRMSEAEARARIAAQLPLADKVAAANHVIDNSGTLENTRKTADEVLERIRAGS